VCSSGLKDILAIHDEPSKNVVHVDGMVCVGVPVGSPAFVQANAKKCIFDIRQQTHNICPQHSVTRPRLDHPNAEGSAAYSTT
jgi:hypothetical protein